jgi:inhibitor of cysteine peptidase
MNMVHPGIRLSAIAILGIVCGSLMIGSILQLETYSSLPKIKDDFGSMQRFKSTSDLLTFLQNRASYPYLSGSGFTDLLKAKAAVNSAADYSTTNVQVAGVDEADMVKTDGKYLYISKDTTVYIALAYPPEDAKIISKIELGEQVGELYIVGDKLVVFSTNYSTFAVEPMPKIPNIMPPTPQTQTTNVRVYDLTNIAKPKLERETKAEGSYITSRLIDDYVYIIVQKGAQILDGKAQPPVMQEGTKTHQVQPTDILYYWNGTEPWYSYTTILSLNAVNPDAPIQSETLLLGTSSTIYVSTQYLYLGIQKWSNTTIQKIRLYNGAITPLAEGTVPGYVLNQFSMDENDGYFRVATTTGRLWWGFRRMNNNQSSAVYILDKSMKTVGKLEGLAPREDIYSARFVGDRCYLVTFKKVDPLFVIDLSDPTSPQVLGKLKIPGFSNYLHPYDENHVIGLGKEATESESGDFAWYQGLKISLFDVTDVTKPKEVAKIEIGDRGTDSPALSDHKAFLFNKAKNLLVIPILEAKIDPTVYENNPPSDAYGDYIYQGAYVFNISINEISLRGRVTHLQDEELLKSGYYIESSNMVTRSLYIGEYLYTISNTMVKISNLGDLKEINTVNLK